MSDSCDKKQAVTPLEPEEAMRRAQDALAKGAEGLGAYHLNACVKCGLCGESCHIYKSDPCPENLPGLKVARVADFYRRYHTLLGRIAPGVVGAKDLSREGLEEIAELVYGRCTACGRCSMHCSVGVDIAAAVRLGRKMVTAAGMTPEGLRTTIDNQLETGNQMEIPAKELGDTAEWLAEDLGIEMGDDDIELPVDRQGARILYLINPREVKFFPLSLMAAAGVFHKAGESWTLSSKCFDVTNYGYFAGDDEAAAELTQRVMDEAERLGVEEIILSECGHGFRSFHWEGPNWVGKEYTIPTRSVLELLEEYLDSGRIKVDPTKNSEKITLHDPCNLVRWGGVVEVQRRILKRICTDFVEMTPNRQNNFCCGGGGGMLSMGEYAERRVASGKVKADQISKTEASIIATPCHNCADQLIEINQVYKLGTEIQAVVELLYNALDTDA